MAIARSPALFLDRDGVINVDHGYVHQIAQFSFIPGIFDLARFATSRGWPIVVVTNQGGIGRGLYREEDFQELSAWMCRRFVSERAPISRIYHCPYHPELGVGHFRAEHPWRKPSPGMILQAALDLDLDLSRSVLIGDKLSDMAAAASAGIAVRILLDPRGLPSAEPPTHRAVRDLVEAMAILRQHAGPADPAGMEAPRGQAM